MQWGEQSVSSPGYFDISFNIAFSSVGYVNAISAKDATDDIYCHQLVSKDTTSARIHDANAGTSNTKFLWFAIGY